ncbi:MAG: VCBS repeat-containing protein [Blastocatellia bacterium]|nr:VCBS repeat-containing protein [Blastocatellia bacterium]
MRNKLNTTIISSALTLLISTSIFGSAVRPFGVGLLANGTLPGGTYSQGGGGIGIYGTNFNDVSVNGNMVLYSSSYPVTGFVPEISLQNTAAQTNQFSRNLTTGEIRCLSCGFYIAANAVIGWGGHSGRITPDGRYAVYAGPNFANNNFVTDQIFRIDLQTGARINASVGPTGADANGISARPVISDDGRYVAFQSIATNLVAGFSGTAIEQVYVRDLEAGVTMLASHAAGSTSAPGNFRIDPNQPITMSSNGRFVAWTSASSNYMPLTSDTNGANDVYYFDVFSAGGNIGCASVNPTGLSTGNGASSGGVVASGSTSFPPKIVFTSSATDLNTSDTNPRSDTFLFDGSSSVKLVSATATGTAGNASSNGLTGISPNGRFVVFNSTSSDLANGVTEPNTMTNDVFLRDVQTNTTQYVSLNSSGQPSNTTAGSFLNPTVQFTFTYLNKSVSDDGRYVAFRTAEPLSLRDTGTSSDIYVRDTRSGVTILATLANQAIGGQNGSFGAVDDFGFAMNARTLFFSLGGNNLQPGDTTFSSNSKVYASKISMLAQRSISDFNDDGVTDPAVFRANEGNWYELLDPIGGAFSMQLLGESGVQVVPGDYDGDRTTDRAVFYPTLGRWEILESSKGQLTTKFLGTATDIVTPADYDGDGRTDLAYFRPSTGGWFISQSNTGLARGVRFGANGDIPVAGDYDGDNKADIAVFRPSTGDWWILASASGSITGLHWGANGDKPVVGDYDGDGRSDAAVYRGGVWYILNSRDLTSSVKTFGLATDRPAVGDYDADGRTDIGVYRPSTSFWYALRSSDNTWMTLKWGNPGDVSISSAYVQ